MTHAYLFFVLFRKTIVAARSVVHNAKHQSAVGLGVSVEALPRGVGARTTVIEVERGSVRSKHANVYVDLRKRPLRGGNHLVVVGG